MVINVQARNFIVSLLVFCFLDTDFPVLYQNLTLVLACPLHVSFYFFFGFVVWPLNLDTLAPKIHALKNDIGSFIKKF